MSAPKKPWSKNNYPANRDKKQNVAPPGSAPTHEVTAIVKSTGKKGQVGVGWLYEGENGTYLSIQLNPCVVLSANDDLVVNVFPVNWAGYKPVSGAPSKAKYEQLAARTPDNEPPKTEISDEALHGLFNHPDYEYMTESYSPKGVANYKPLLPDPVQQGWELNRDHKGGHTVLDDGSEETYWRRRKTEREPALKPELPANPF